MTWKEAVEEVAQRERSLMRVFGGRRTKGTCRFRVEFWAGNDSDLEDESAHCKDMGQWTEARSATTTAAIEGLLLSDGWRRWE